MDFGTAFSYAFQDEEWLKKLAIASLMAFLGLFFGIGFIFLLGWTMEILRRAKDGDYSLPDWADFGTLFIDGLKAVAIVLIWLIPALVIGGCIGGGVALLGDSGNRLGILGVALTAISSCVALPYLLAVLLLIPAMLGILADTGNFGEALNPANAFNLFRNNIGGYLIALLIQMFAIPILTSVGGLFCGIGAFPASAYGSSIMGNLYGQAYAAAIAK